MCFQFPLCFIFCITQILQHWIITFLHISLYGYKEVGLRSWIYAGAKSCKATLVDSLTKNMELEMSTMSLLMFYINGIPLNL